MGMTRDWTDAYNQSNTSISVSDNFHVRTKLSLSLPFPVLPLSITLCTYSPRYSCTLLLLVCSLSSFIYIQSLSFFFPSCSPHFPSIPSSTTPCKLTITNTHSPLSTTSPPPPPVSSQRHSFYQFRITELYYKI